MWQSEKISAILNFKMFRNKYVLLDKYTQNINMYFNVISLNSF